MSILVSRCFKRRSSGQLSLYHLSKLYDHAYRRLYIREKFTETAREAVADSINPRRDESSVEGEIRLPLGEFSSGDPSETKLESVMSGERDLLRTFRACRGAEDLDYFPPIASSKRNDQANGLGYTSVGVFEANVAASVMLRAISLGNAPVSSKYIKPLYSLSARPRCLTIALPYRYSIRRGTRDEGRIWSSSSPRARENGSMSERVREIGRGREGRTLHSWL